MTDPAPDANALRLDDDAAVRHARIVALVLAGISFMGGLDGTIILTALPQMAIDFGVVPTSLSSTITVYILVAAALMPVSAWLGEHFGTRTVFTVSVAGFTGASVLCGLATSLETFIAARALQAAFASLMGPVGSLILLRSTPKHFLVSAMAISTTPALLAPVIGPPLGGFITSFLDWPWVFFINAPLGLIGIMLSLRFIPQLRSGRRAPFDAASFLLTSGALCAVIFGLDRLAAADGSKPLAGAITATGLVLGWFAVRHARRARNPLVPLTALRHQCFRASMLGAGNLVRLPFSAHSFALPLMLQLGLGFSAFHAGLLLLAQNGGDLILKPIASRALRRMGFRIALVSGSVTMALSLAACALLDPAMPFMVAFALLFVVGMARSILFTGIMALTFADVPETEMGGASVVNSLVWAVSSALGISLAALLLNLIGGPVAPSLGAFRVVVLVLAGIALLAAPGFAMLSADAGHEVTGRGRAPVA